MGQQQPQRFGSGLFGAPLSPPQPIGTIQPIDPRAFMDAGNMAREKMGLEGMLQIDPNSRYQMQMEQNLQRAMAEKDYTASAGQQVGALISSLLGGASPYGGVAQQGQQQLKALENNLENDLAYKNAQQQQAFDVMKNFFVNQGAAPETAQALALNPNLYDIPAKEAQVGQMMAVRENLMQNRAQANQLRALGLQQQAEQNMFNRRLQTAKLDLSRRKFQAGQQEGSGKNLLDEISKKPELLTNPQNVTAFVSELGNQLATAQSPTEAKLIYKNWRASMEANLDRAVTERGLSTAYADGVKRMFQEAVVNNPYLTDVLKEQILSVDKPALPPKEREEFIRKSHQYGIPLPDHLRKYAPPIEGSF